MARLEGLRVGDKSVVTAVEAFGSRAGSTFRGRGPLSTSDLDLLVTIDPRILTGRNGPWVRNVLAEIGRDFEREAGFALSLYAPDNVGTFRQSISGARFLQLFRR